jgi:hypothetical protein
MFFDWALRPGLVVAIGLWVLGDAPGAAAAPIRSEKGKDVTYAEKLVGTWVSADDDHDGKVRFDKIVEFSADGGLNMTDGPADVSGTWKAVKEEGKTLTIESAIWLFGFGDRLPNKKTFLITFEDRDTIVMSMAGDRPNTRKLKRKP